MPARSASGRIETDESHDADAYRFDKIDLSKMHGVWPRVPFVWFYPLGQCDIRIRL